MDASSIVKDLKWVARKWTKQRKAEHREAKQRANR